MRNCSTYLYKCFKYKPQKQITLGVSKAITGQENFRKKYEKKNRHKRQVSQRNFWKNVPKKWPNKLSTRLSEILMHYMHDTSRINLEGKNFLSGVEKIPYTDS